MRTHVILKEKDIEKFEEILKNSPHIIDYFKLINSGEFIDDNSDQKSKSTEKPTLSYSRHALLETMSDVSKVLGYFEKIYQKCPTLELMARGQAVLNALHGFQSLLNDHLNEVEDKLDK